MYCCGKIKETMYFCQRLCHVEVCGKLQLQLAVLPLSDTDAQSLVDDGCRESAECDAASGGSGSRRCNIPMCS